MYGWRKTSADAEKRDYDAQEMQQSEGRKQKPKKEVYRRNMMQGGG